MTVRTGEVSATGRPTAQPVCGSCGVSGHVASACPRPVCDEFEPDTGGAHPWCARCGWQARFHPARDVSGAAPGEGPRRPRPRPGSGTPDASVSEPTNKKTPPRPGQAGRRHDQDH